MQQQLAVSRYRLGRGALTSSSPERHSASSAGGPPSGPSRQDAPSDRPPLQGPSAGVSLTDAEGASSAAPPRSVACSALTPVCRSRCPCCEPVHLSTAHADTSDLLWVRPPFGRARRPLPSEQSQAKQWRAASWQL